MQTFVPVPSWAGSAALLDQKRLGKQRVETYQIMKALVLGSGWSNHPATRMWRGHEAALMAYQRATVAEWVSRGYADTCLAKTQEVFSLLGIAPLLGEQTPPWLGDERVHLSHQANLVRKDPARYGALFPGVEPVEGYFWPN